MGKTAFVFPGQGSQYVGMAKEFYDSFPESKKIFDDAADVLDFDIVKLCFEENEDINKTEYTQAAILTAEIAIYEHLKTMGIEADVCAGLSLGEYSALVAAGVMVFKDAVRIVRQRGILMQDAVPEGEGAMAAVMGLQAENIEKICLHTNGAVSIANYNCPSQIVISGETAELDEVCAKLTDIGAKKVTKLKVSGPFHSNMLREAGNKLYEKLSEVKLNKPQIPYVSNTYASFVTDESQVRNILKEQVYSSVKWEQSVQEMIKDGVDTFVEIGPKKTLCSFIKRINREVKCLNVDKIADLGNF